MRFTHRAHHGALLQIALIGTGDSDEVIEQEVEAISQMFSESVAEVISSIVGTVRSGANDGCDINVINEAQVWPS